jgi:hypothetical protein
MGSEISRVYVSSVAGYLKRHSSEAGWGRASIRSKRLARQLNDSRTRVHERIGLAMRN